MKIADRPRHYWEFSWVDAKELQSIVEVLRQVPMDGILELVATPARLERYLELIHDRPRNPRTPNFLYLHDDDKRTHIRTIKQLSDYQPGPYIGTWHWYVLFPRDEWDIWYFRCSSVLNAPEVLAAGDISIDPLKVKVAENIIMNLYTKRERNVLESGVATLAEYWAKQ
ncbi:hypothetical protein SPFM14_00150 [Salmonella phage SPFM14]|nr:hypothetical protein SPFM14_00150 [Salmonella phage SPFM14]